MTPTYYIHGWVAWFLLTYNILYVCAPSTSACMLVCWYMYVAPLIYMYWPKATRLMICTYTVGVQMHTGMVCVVCILYYGVRGVHGVHGVHTCMVCVACIRTY
eukprot:COSAG01_NODE_583_length_15194_cov_5.640808_9_plen_103_part_00